MEEDVRMNLQQLIGSRFTVNVDGRASRRDIGQPDRIAVESTFRLGDRAGQIDHMMRSDVVPAVFVDADAQIWQLTAGGSGLVMFESADGSPLTDEQADALGLVETVLGEFFGIAEPAAKPEPKPVAKKKPKKAKEPDVVLAVAYPEDEPTLGILSDEILSEIGDNL